MLPKHELTLHAFLLCSDRLYFCAIRRGYGIYRMAHSFLSDLVTSYF